MGGAVWDGCQFRYAARLCSCGLDQVMTTPRTWRSGARTSEHQRNGAWASNGSTSSALPPRTRESGLRRTPWSAITPAERRHRAARDYAAAAQAQP